MKFVCLAAMLESLAFAQGDAFAVDDGIPVARSQYQNRPLLPEFTATPCPDTPRGLEQIKGNLYRHTTGGGLAVHSGLVLEP